MTSTSELAKLVDLLTTYGVRLGRPDLREKLATRLVEEGMKLDDLRVLGDAIFETERAVLDKAALLASIVGRRDRWTVAVAELRQVIAAQDARASKRQTKAERKAQDRAERDAVRDKAQQEQDRFLADQYGLSVEEFQTFRLGRALHSEGREDEDPDAVAFYLERK